MQLASSGIEPVRSSGPAVKEQVVDKIPKRFKELKFGVQYVQCDCNFGIFVLTLAA